MDEENEKLVKWEDAVVDNFVKIEDGETKKLCLMNWKLVEVDKFDELQVEFISDVVEEDGKVVDKKFTTTSNPLKTKLRPFLETKDPKEGAVLQITRVGVGKKTQYAVK